MKLPGNLRILSAVMTLPAGGMAEPAHPAAITKIESGDLPVSLPRPILNRIQVAELQAPEVREAWRDLMPGMPEASLVDVNATPNAPLYRATDGTTYCCDNSTMSLWILRGERWECLLQGLNIRKTLGGAPPHLPVQYLGKGYFAFSQTTPNEERELPEDKFPQARAITYLLNSGDGKVIARSESFRYDHTPPVKIPDGWYSLTDTTPQPSTR